VGWVILEGYRPIDGGSLFENKANLTPSYRKKKRTRNREETGRVRANKGQGAVKRKTPLERQERPKKIKEKPAKLGVHSPSPGSS